MTAPYPADMSEPLAPALAEAWPAVVDAAHELVLALDLDGTVTRANRAAAELTGFPTADLEGRALGDLAAGGGDRLEIAFRTALAGRVGQTGAVRFTGRGADVVVQVRVAPLRAATDETDEPGEIVGAVLCGRDLTEISETQRSMAEMGEMLRRLQELGRVGLWAWDVASDTVQWSAEMHRIHGVAPDEFGGTLRDHLAVVDPDARAGVEAALRRTAESGEPFAEEFSAAGPHDGGVWIQARADLRTDDADRVVAVQGIHQDLTERYAAEEQMRAALERERQAVEELQEADRLKDEFLDTVSHEFRTPISIVSGYAEVLLRDVEANGVGSNLRAPLEAVLRNARHLHQMVAQILDMSRLDAGRVMVAPERLVLVDVVAAALDDADEPLRAGEILVDVAGELEVHADPMAMSRILTNLLTNAAKYSDGATRVEVAAEPDGDRVVVRVTDQGGGIPADRIETLFDRFVKVERPDQSEGFGLGLTIARRFAELQGGAMWVESTESVGSSFFFSVPIWQES